LDVARPGIKGILSINPDCDCMNFSLAGLQFGSQKEFKKGEKIILDISVSGVVINEMIGQVMTVQEIDDCKFCIGVRFCFEEKSMQHPEISRALLQIEDKLRLAEEYPYSAQVSASF
jgi:hypothetical protein